MDAAQRKNEPWLQFYLNDWLGQTRGCSLAARGLAIDMFCVMHQHGQPYGYLAMPAGKPMPPAKLANRANCSLKEFLRLVDELLSEQVFARTPEGVLYSPWLVRMFDYRTKKSNAALVGIEKRKRNSAGAFAPATAGTPAGAGDGADGGTHWNLASDSVESGLSVPNSSLDFNAARELLAHLNEKAAADFRENPGDLQEIAMRLHESGGSVVEVKVMLDRQCALWKADPKMQSYLRPTTLFESVKFHQYFGQRNLPVAATQTQGDGSVKINGAAVTARLHTVRHLLMQTADASSPEELVARRRLLLEQAELMEQQKKATQQ